MLLSLLWNSSKLESNRSGHHHEIGSIDEHKQGQWHGADYYVMAYTGTDVQPRPLILNLGNKKSTKTGQSTKNLIGQR